MARVGDKYDYVSEVYSSISDNFHLVHTNGTGQSYVEVNDIVQYGQSRTITVLPDPVTWRAGCRAKWP